MNQQPVYVFAKWQVKPGALETVLAILKEVAAKSEAEPGNLFYKVHQSAADPQTIILFESYAGQAAADAHRNSEHFQSLVVGKIVPNLDHREVIPVLPLSFA